MLPLLLLGGLAALILASSKPSSPMPQAQPTLPPANPYLGLQPAPPTTQLPVSAAGYVTPMGYVGSVGGHITPMGFVGDVLEPNGVPPGTPATRGTVHTGCSCCRTGAPVVLDRWGRPFLMVSGYDF